MQHRNSYLPGSGLIVLLATVILFVPWLGETLFYSKGEPREAVVAVSILNSGNWTLPLCFGSDMPYKPPFLAWLIAILARVFNGGHVNEFIARLPSALALTGMIMAGYRWASAVHGKRFAMVFSFITMTAFEVFRAGMACRVDMVLTALMVVPIYIMYELREDPGRKVRHRRLRVLAAWLMLSGATLTKGPVGALLPCFAFGVYCLLRRDRFWPTFGRMISLALASFVLPAIWYYAAYRQGGQPFLDLMYEEVFGRLFGTMSYESHVNPAWYNIVTLLSGLLPWTLFLLFLLFRVRRFHYVPPRTPGLFCTTVAITIILFYCIPESKRSVYLLPAYPFLC
ncbi:MAG: glycosyltransferase family 39 protein, partial [Muribaculaceae bacterium]|nr:glycosyltransferase family 39 protein [Muribaculaceae bacterium]